MSELSCAALLKRYGDRTVLRDVDLTVATGTMTAVLGSSGSGKTTLLRLIMGFIAPDGGSVRIGDTVVADGTRSLVAAEQRAVGYVAQEGALFPHLSVCENVAFGLPRGERRSGNRAADTLALVGLDSTYLDRRPGELSGGEQRRVALARALAPRPGVVLLDEPFSGLDAALRAETRDAVRHALTEVGATAVLVTHDQSEAMSMGRMIAVLRDGRMVQHGSPIDVYGNPADLELARFIGEAVVVPGRCEGDIVHTELGPLPVRGVPCHGSVNAVIRPEQIHLAEHPASPQAVAARVLERTFFGSHSTLRLAVGADDGSGTTVLAKTSDPVAPRLSEQVTMTVSGQVVVFPLTAPTPIADPTEGPR